MVVSFGAFGLYLAFFTLAITGLTTSDPQVLRTCYLAMGILSSVLILPVNLAVVISGLVLALGTQWGLFRYYWVVTKLVLTLFLATASILGLRARISEAIGNLDAIPSTAHDVGSVGTFLVVALPIAMCIYIANTVLAIYKPWRKIRRTQPA